MDRRQAVDELPPAYTRSSSAHSPSRSSPQASQSHTLAEGDERLRSFDDAYRRDSLLEFPPAYTAFDDSLTRFSLSTPIIHAICVEDVLRPRYQLSQQLSNSGKLWRLKIRRLLPSEARRLSTSSSTSPVNFDSDTTLYIIENTSAMSSFQKPRIAIRGRKAGTLRGHVEMNNVSGTTEFRHCTRPAERDPLREENLKKMNKWGYHAEDEWQKKVLFTCRKGSEGFVRWKDNEDAYVASENGDGLQIEQEIEEKIRDVLVTCWATRHWVDGNLKFEEKKPSRMGLVKSMSLGSPPTALSFLGSIGI